MFKIGVYVKLYAHKNLAGGELYLHNLLKEIKEYYDDFVIDVYLPNNEIENKIEYEGINIIEIEKENLEILLDYDLVITQLDYTKNVCEFCLKHNKKCFLIVHSYSKDLYSNYTKNNKIFVIYNCIIVKDDYINNNHSNKNNITINPYCDFKKLSSYFCQNMKEKEYITFINPLSFKGAEIVLYLAKHFKERKFLIVKGGYYPEQQEEYLKEFRKLVNCHIIDNTKDIINKVYLKSRIVIQPSQWETWGMITNEASAMGIPTIINKGSPALLCNLGGLAFMGYSPDKVEDIKDIEEYINYINYLDDKKIYALYSNYCLERAKYNYKIRQKQLNTFLINFKNIINNI